MPKYLNTSSYPIFYNNTVFTSNRPIETYDVLNNQAFIFGIVGEPYTINAGVNDVLKIRFNDEDVWTTVTLTAGAAQTTNDIVADINAAYGSTVAFNEGDRLKIVAPRVSSDLSAVWLDSTAGGSTANPTLGLVGHTNNPSGLAAKQAFLNSTNLEPYAITSANNKFIFRFNGDSWITATLTTGAARTAQEIADDINSAYRIATGRFETVAKAVELITGSGDIQVQLISPIVNNYKSSIYIKTFGNTALTVLGFDSDDVLPLVINGYPQLVQLEILPLFNPLISTTTLTFPGAGWTTFYVNEESVSFEFIRVTAVSVNIYIEDIHNLPPINLAAGEKISFKKTSDFSKFIIQSLGAGDMTILELRS